MAFLDIQHLEKSFGPTRVVKDFNLDIEKGEFVSFLGPSGCGKTTVLRMVAGFEAPTSGAIRIDGREVTGLAANRRNIGMVFQSYALFPNLTVAENIGFGLKVAGEGKAAIARRVGEMLDLIGLPQLEGRYPFQLSGGQQQRVALARALAPRPQVLLLDEPLSALDAKVRISLRDEIRRIQRDLGITAIFVTHDQEEALSISDRVVVMHQGVADQVGTPFEIYNRPATRFVAQFVGTLNLLDADVLDATTGKVRLGGVPVALDQPLEGRPGERISLAMRPESVELGRSDCDRVVLSGEIAAVHFLGSVIRIKVAVAGQFVSLDTFNQPDRPPPSVGTTVEVSLPHRDLLVLAA
ncbi:ABC transporter ATP-binding protein [Ensifer adhaerens]|uniref:ABC transporter ATP-binding protein n=1 Tax=Ensifer TaxID=106591 RepID=UPI00072712D1|nr:MULTISPECIES: ABC transporter ATP-binding protein [Ensifer]KSV77355.1 ABC transporter [Sinorhizobium sp. GL2]MBD9544110.1 ABC transporter ATP-binding protein [Ensifer sp. ENS04]UTV41109.1 ABC transporter ATP-binding protein [Ensifer adhaerens]SFH32128.1 putative spermidine/putrescine transport system ATP-binding protein [Ensifer sp. OV372]